MRFSRPAVAIMFVVLGFAAGTARGAEAVKIRLAWIAPSNWAAILLEKRDLAKHLGKSYVLEPVRYSGSPPMVTALATGDLEIATLAFSTIGIAIQNAGMDDLRIIGDEIQDGVQGYYSQEFMVLADGPIKKVEDLKGKVVATAGVGAGVDIAMRAMLRRHGLEDKRDFTTIETPFPSMRAMLAERKVDLVQAVIPFSAAPDYRKGTRTLFDQKEAFGVTQLLAWTARKPFIDGNRAAIVDFMEDALRISRWFLDPANKAAVSEIMARVTRQPRESLDWVFTGRDYFHDPNLTPNLEALQQNVNLTKDLGFIKASVDIPKFADLSLVREAAARLK
jgi:sulfonate transport system substrate-binding protein